MAKIRFNLRDRKVDTKEVPLYLIIEVKKRKILKYPTGIKVCPNHWNYEKETVRKSNVSFDRYNQKISQLRNIATKALADIEAENEVVTGNEIRMQLDGTTNRKKGYDGTVRDFLKKYIDKLPLQVNTKTGRGLSRQTFNKFECLKNVLAEMEKAESKVLTFQNVDLDFYHRFVNFLQDKDFQPNTIGSKYIQTLKTILNEAERQNIKVNKAYKDRKFATMSEQKTEIYLTPSEIESIEKLDLSGVTRLERVRDAFIVGYYTGQRFGDFSTFTKEQFEIEKESIKGTLKLLQNKVAVRVEVPINEKVIKIMEKYNWKFKKISAKSFNIYIKEVAELAKIDKMISETFQKGKNEITTLTPKYQKVSSHTARRSFATNAFTANPSMIMHIMKVTGHTTEKHFMTYICFTSDENKLIMENLLVRNEKTSLLKAV